MKTSESIAAIAPALLEVQKTVHTVKKGSDNPYFKSKYADLATVAEATYPVLHKAGIVVVQGSDDTGLQKGEQLTITRLIHAASGEWIESRYKSDTKTEDPQAHGSAMTYARRYSLMAILGLVAEDDDAEKAMSGYRQQQQRQPVGRPTPPPPPPMPQEAPAQPTPVRGAKGEVEKEYNSATGEYETVLSSPPKPTGVPASNAPVAGGGDMCPKCNTNKISVQVLDYYAKNKPNETPICYSCQKAGKPK